MFSLMSIAPYLAATGDALLNLDENTSGADDFAGALLVYVGATLAAVANDEELPEFPDELKGGISDRITGAARVSLILASSILSIAQFQVSGKAGKAIKYAVQAIRQLLAGKAVPIPPAEITA